MQSELSRIKHAAFIDELARLLNHNDMEKLAFLDGYKKQIAKGFLAASMLTGGTGVTGNVVDRASNAIANRTYSTADAGNHFRLFDQNKYPKVISTKEQDALLDAVNGPVSGQEKVISDAKKRGDISVLPYDNFNNEYKKHTGRSAGNSVGFSVPWENGKAYVREDQTGINSTIMHELGEQALTRQKDIPDDPKKPYMDSNEPMRGNGWGDNAVRQNHNGILPNYLQHKASDSLPDQDSYVGITEATQFADDFIKKHPSNNPQLNKLDLRNTRYNNLIRHGYNQQRARYLNEIANR